MLKKHFIRKIVIVASLFFLSSFVYAKQISLDYYIGEKSYNYTGAAVNSKASWEFIPFGISMDTVWSKVTDGGVFEPGFDLDFGLFLAGSPTISGNGNSVKTSGFFSLGQWVSFSPSFGFNFGADRHTIRLVPGLQMNLGEAFCNTSSKSETIIDIYMSLSLKAIYNFWFNDKIGLNAGMDFDIPLLGVSVDDLTYNGRSYSDAYFVSGGSDFRLFFGVTFR